MTKVGSQMIVLLLISTTTIHSTQGAWNILLKGVAVPLVEKLASKAGDGVVTWMKDQVNSGSVSVSQPALGAVWISFVQGSVFSFKGEVCSFFYHPTRTHTATTVGKLGQKRSVAGAGDWAVSCQTKKMTGNKAYYN